VATVHWVAEDPTWAKLVRTAPGVVDAVEGLAEVVGHGVGGDETLAGFDLDGSVAAGCFHEFPDRPAGLVLDPAADSQGGEHNGQVGFDRVALAVVDGPGLQVVL
jgi:pimeloyl-ACP methyl ester carboxylesterase